VSAFGTHRVRDKAATNNYGELLAMKHALMIAKKEGAKRIFGDSKLVIEYWSQWRMKRKDLPEETVSLAAEVAELREAFESRGGEVIRIGGGANPADLGFHR
jgi:ribonuclease HI